MILIAEWLNSNVALGLYDNQFKIGDTGELRLYVMPSDVQYELDLSNSGIEKIDMVQGQGVIIMHFRKIDTLSTLKPLSLSIPGQIVGWQLFKDGIDISPVAYFVVGILGYVLVDKLLFKGKRNA